MRRARIVRLGSIVGLPDLKGEVLFGVGQVGRGKLANVTVEAGWLRAEKFGVCFTL